MTARRWRLWRRSSQGAFLALFLGTVVLSCRWSLPWAGGLFLRLDALAGLVTMLAGRGFPPAFLPSLSLLLLTLLLGRVWCGWICPLGTLLEWTGRRRASLRLHPVWPRVKYGLLLALVAGASLGVSGLLLLDPLALLERGLVGIGRPVLKTLLGDERSPWQPAEVTPSFLLVGLLALNLLFPRLWCRALCPLGALLAWLSRPVGLRRRVGEKCIGCGECAARCPMGAVQEETGESRPGECILCLECVDCPQGATGWRWLPPGRPAAVDLSRRAVLLALGSGLLLGLLLRLERAWNRKSPRLLRPPGAVEEEVLAHCLRCGTCLAACPTGALRPAFLESGVEGLWTPLFVPRLGYCRYLCNACGQACPQALQR